MISDGGGEKLKQKQFKATGEKHEREHVHVVLVVGVVRQKRPVGHRYCVDAHDRTATRLKIIIKIIYVLQAAAVADITIGTPVGTRIGRTGRKNILSPRISICILNIYISESDITQYTTIDLPRHST